MDRRKPRSTPSVVKLSEWKRQEKIKQQQKRWKEVTEKGLGSDTTGEMDLEEAMMSPGEEEKQTDKDTQKTGETEGYGEVYTKTHEKRAERSLSRAEKREQDEKCKKEEEAKKAAQEEVDRLPQEEAKRVIKRAQLEEKESAVQRRIDRKRKLQDRTEDDQTTQSGSGKPSAMSKKQWK